MTLKIRPLTIREANQIVGRWHRHSRPVVGALFAVGVEQDGELCGAAIVGRPVARGLQDGLTCEVLRCCTNGTYNACSILYGACRSAAKALGFNRVVTYTLADEPGTSLVAAGFVKVAVVAARNWTRLARYRVTTDLFGERITPDGDKIRWEWRR